MQLIPRAGRRYMISRTSFSICLLLAARALSALSSAAK